MPTPVGLQQQLLLLLRVGAAQANTFAPPVQLHNCSAGAATQRWHQAANGSSYILDACGHVGYQIPNTKLALLCVISLARTFPSRIF